MKNILFITESICISAAVFGICVFDSNCIAGAALLLIFGSGLAVCIRIEERYGSRCLRNVEEGEENRMKNKKPRKPTREQKKRMSNAGFDWKQYLIVDSDHISMIAVHKQTGRRSVIIC